MKQQLKSNTAPQNHHGMLTKDLFYSYLLCNYKRFHISYKSESSGLSNICIYYSQLYCSST